MPGKTIHSVNDLPRGEHYAILSLRRIHIPGDERSRTNPGHGYPAHDMEAFDYCVYKNTEEFEKDLKAELAMGADVVGLHVDGVYRAKKDIVLERNT